MPFAIPLAIKTIAGPILSKVVDIIKSKVLGIKDNAKSNPLMYVVPIIIIVLMAIIIIPNLDSIKEKLGIETTKSLSIKLAQEEHNTDIALETNAKLIENNEIVEKLENTEDEITEELLQEIEVANKKTLNIKEKTTSKITKIMKDTKLSEQQKREEISSSNIASIWQSYCSFNQDVQCKQAA